MSPTAPALTRRHHQRLREIHRSAGWPCLDMLEVELLAAGLLERWPSPEGFERLRVTDAGIQRLAEVFGQALLERDAGATPEQVAQAREKAHRAPWLMLVVVDGQRGDPAVDLAERILSAGCAVQNALLMATALGFGSALTSGKALKSDSLRALFGLQAGEQALCFVSVGTVRARKPARVRPAVAEFLSTLGELPAKL